MTPDGEAREVANELAFPNGMVITPNKTIVVAESFAARGQERRSQLPLVRSVPLLAGPLLQVARGAFDIGSYAFFRNLHVARAFWLT